MLEQSLADDPGPPDPIPAGRDRTRARRGEGGPRLAQAALLARLAAAVVALAATPALPDTTRAALVAAVLLVYLPYTVLVWLLEGRGDAGRYRRLTAIGDIAAIFVVAALIPPLRVVALLGYLLAVAYHTLREGVGVGGSLAAGAAVLAGLTEAAGSAEDGLGALTLLMFVAALALLVYLIHSVTGEHQRMNRHLARLHEAVRAFPAAPDLDATLDAIARAARDAVGADRLEVVLHAEETGTPPDLRRLQHQRLDGGGSAVVVPLRSPTSVVGALHATKSSGRGFHDSDLDLLGAYAEQAGLTIARALAFEQQRAAVRQLQQVDRLQGDVLIRLSHELRTPLTGVLGYLRTLSTYWERLAAAQQRDMVDRALHSAGTLERLVRDLLDFSQPDSAAAEPEAVDLEEALVAAVHQRARLLERHRVQISAPPGVHVLASPHTLDRVLGHLLDNAVAYSPPGTEVTLVAVVADDRAVVTVGDEGPGIPAGELENVFEPFFRGSTIDPGHRGTGTGLSLVQRLVTLLGGQVWAESVPGAGTAFSFTLPLACRRT